MKKKNLSFMTLFMLTATLIGGCSCNKQSDENVNSLVIKVGEKEYSAKDLYNELLSTGTGANEAFAKVLRLVVEQSMETTPNIQAAADLAAESFEEEVKNDAASYGTSIKESRKKLLEEKGYESVEQLKSDIIYERKLDLITETYWEDNKGAFFNEYIANRLPYLVRHVLVKIDDSNANKIANNVSISESDAKRIVDVVKDLEKEGDFVETAHLYSEDTGSTGVGGAYYMDYTYGVNGFVDEFVYGTYAFDTYTTRSETTVGETKKVTYTFGKDQDKYNKLVGLTDTETFAEYYTNGFNFVDMSVVNMMSEVDDQTSRNNKDYFPISNYQSNGDEATGDMNSSENYYARSILFNKAFNKPGVSVIGYNTEKEAKDAGAKHYVEYKVGTETKYILADENDNAIFFVAARGSGNAIWLHFLTINVSALDDLENAKKFFSLTPDYEDDYVSYVELMSKTDSTTERNTYINELESYVKSYKTSGTGNATGEESILKYDMVRHYMEKNNITYLNDQLKEAINSYIDNKKSYLSTSLLNSISDDWDTHTDKLAMSMNELVTMDIKPYECAVLVDKEAVTRDNPYSALNTSNDVLCRYVYGTGYQVKLNYFYENTNSTPDSESFTSVTSTNTNTLYFNENSDYVQFVGINKDNNHVALAIPQVADGYKFEGWYTHKSLSEESRVPESGGRQYIDLSESRMNNNTIFFAKIVKVATVKYTYVNTEGQTVTPQVSNTNVSYVEFTTTGELVVDTTKFTFEGSNESVKEIKFAKNNGAISSATTKEDNTLALEESDLGKVINVYVVVEGGNE